MTGGWTQTTVIVIGLALLAALMNQLPPAWVNGFRLFNGFAIAWMLVWVIREILPYRRLLIIHREDLLEVFRHEEEKRAQEFADLKRKTDEIAKRLSEENQRRHTEVTNTLAELKKPEGPA